MGIKMKGWDKARTSFHTLKDEYSSYVNDAVREHTDEVFQETQTRVPRKTEALAGTGLIEPISTAGEKISYKIWYGEPGEGPYTIDYAAAVHEILKAKHVPPTGAKYVEQPLIESVPNAKARIARKMGEAVRGAFQ